MAQNNFDYLKDPDQFPQRTTTDQENVSNNLDNLEYDEDLHSLQASNLNNLTNACPISSNKLPGPGVNELGHSNMTNLNDDQDVHINNNYNNNNHSHDNHDNGLESLHLRHQSQIRSNHSITDVYELAAAIGNTMETLISEFGQEKMQNLTKEIVRCLEAFEKTVNTLTKETENSLEYQYSLEKSSHEVNQLKSRHESDVKNLDNTIDQLQATIETLQISNDALLENFDWDDIINQKMDSSGNEEFLNVNNEQPTTNNNKESSYSAVTSGKATQTELQLAKKLRIQTEKCSRLEAILVEQNFETSHLYEKVKVYSEHFPDFRIDDFVAPFIPNRRSTSSFNESTPENLSSNPSTPRGTSKMKKQNSVSRSNKSINRISENNNKDSRIEVKRLNSAETATHTERGLAGTHEDDMVSMVELQKILRDKNWYKEKCFTMEDQLMEYKMLLANYELSQAGAISGLGTPKHASKLMSTRNYEQFEHAIAYRHGAHTSKKTSNSDNKALTVDSFSQKAESVASDAVKSVASYFSPVAPDPKKDDKSLMSKNRDRDKDSLKGTEQLLTTTKNSGSDNFKIISSTPIKQDQNRKENLGKSNSGVSSSSGSRTGAIINKGLKFFTSKDSG